MPTDVTKKVPAKACQFSAGACEFAEGHADDNARGPIKLVAASGAVFNHWYWGPMVFDIAGMKLSKPKITLDYCHWQDEVVGYADQIDTSGKQLKLAGELVSSKPDDRAAEILTKGRAGVPYEGSIKFDPFNGLVIEEYSAGVPVEVNGRTEVGPLTVIRECLLRGVAVCPYGADPYTQSEFSSGGDKDAADVTMTIKQITQEAEMADTQETNTETKTPEQVRTELVATNKDYADRFGVELAAQWGPLGEGKPLLDCYAEFVEKLREDNKAALAARDTAHETAIAELKTKLADAEKKATEAEERLTSLSLGEESAVSGNPPQKPGEKAQVGSTPAADAFAAEFSLPTGKMDKTE